MRLASYLALTLTLTLTLGLATATSATAQSVWVVDMDGGVGVDFTSLATAVTTAADGDILLLRESPLSQPVVEIVGKSLTILGDPAVSGQRPSIDGVNIRDLLATQQVTLRGVRIGAQVVFNAAMLSAKDCAGAVLIEDVTSNSSSGVVPAPFADFSGSSRVVLTRCDFQAAAAMVSPGASPPIAASAVECSASSVAIYDCVLRGGDGNAAAVNPFTGVVAPPAGDGGAGLNLISGKALIAGSSAIGGAGGAGAFVHGVCFAPGGGGPGIRVAGALQRLDSTATGGVGGSGVAGCVSGRVGAAVLQVGAGTVTTIADTLRRFEVSTPVYEGTSALNTIAGVPGEVVLLLIAFSPDGTIVPSVHGALAGSGPFLSVLLGPLPANGALAFAVPIGVGTIPAAIEGLLFYEQIIVAGASGFGLLGTPSAITIVR